MAIIDKNPFKEKELSWIDKTEEKEVIEIGNESEILVIDNKDFDYTSIDEDTKSYLKEQELEMHLTMTKAYTKLGEILYRTQETLAVRGYGCFLEWIGSLGFKKTKAYTLIDRYKLILEFQNSEKEELIENLPISLAYEISKKSADEELKEMVLSGDIKTLKEYREYRDLYKEEKPEIIEKEDKDIVLELANLISKNRSFDEKSDYELASLIMKEFKIKGRN